MKPGDPHEEPTPGQPSGPEIPSVPDALPENVRYRSDLATPGTFDDPVEGAHYNLDLETRALLAGKTPDEMFAEETLLGEQAKRGDELPNPVINELPTTFAALKRVVPHALSRLRDTVRVQRSAADDKPGYPNIMPIREGRVQRVADMAGRIVKKLF